ncbi:hypothetical protein BC827DRAFT_1215324 [Russula dissimulans]|nr:hypothetical protein BC827DRAFT_1215324 [Russula dissimulans]
MAGRKVRSYPTSHIGIAVYVSDYSCEHWVIVLSTNRLFEGPVLCGTVFEDVNGWHLAWTTCDDSPATWSLYMSFRGIVHVAKAEMPLTHIRQFISTGPRLKLICANDEVLRLSTIKQYAIDSLHRLCEEDYISSPAEARGNFYSFVSKRSLRFSEKPKPNHRSYPIVPFEGGVIFGRTRV